MIPEWVLTVFWVLVVIVGIVVAAGVISAVILGILDAMKGDE